MSFPRYPKYKASGVEWLGDVPEHWELDPLKSVSQLFGRIGFRGYTTGDIVGQDEGAITLSPSNMTALGMVLDDCTFISWEKYHESPEIMIRPHDVLMVKTGSTLGKVAYVPDSDREMTVNPQIVVFKNIACSPRYLFYFLSTPYIQASVEVKNAGSSIPTITQQSIGNFPITIPPASEQSKIASFLDRETSKIDGLVGEQRRLIELLKEKRQAVISHAVTKGLNPHAPLKPSGIEWLGDVPEHWMVLPLHRVVQERRRITYGIVQPGEPDPTGRFMVRGQDYSTGWSNPDSIFRVSDAIEVPYQRARLRSGDLVITIVGAGVGNIAVVPDWLDGANITQTTARIAVDPRKANPEFVAGVLQGPIGKRSVELYAKGAAQPGLNLEHVRIFPVTVPPIDEQRQIAAFIHRETSRLDALTAEAERGIELLQERRTALISAAVTGQIDVRGLAETGEA